MIMIALNKIYLHLSDTENLSHQKLIIFSICSKI